MIGDLEILGQLENDGERRDERFSEQHGKRRHECWLLGENI